jgi:hypothetical protein
MSPEGFDPASARPFALDGSGDLLGVAPPGGGCWLVDLRTGCVVMRLGGEEVQGFVAFGGRDRVLVRATSSRLEGTRVERERRPVDVVRADVERTAK